MRAGLTLVPFSLTGESEAVAVGKVGVQGIPVELVGPAERQSAIESIKRWVRADYGRPGSTPQSCRQAAPATESTAAHCRCAASHVHDAPWHAPPHNSTTQLPHVGAASTRAWWATQLHPTLLFMTLTNHRTTPFLPGCSQYPDLVLVDYTLPQVLNGNAEFYCQNKLPFVMGTTGGDRDKLLADVKVKGAVLRCCGCWVGVILLRFGGGSVGWGTVPLPGKVPFRRARLGPSAPATSHLLAAGFWQLRCDCAQHGQADCGIPGGLMWQLC